ncbi:MAG: radical SAM protein [bacterium]|nr:radical SAM protein [bacterium]
MAFFDFAKRYVGGLVIEEGLNYLAKNPERNIEKLINLARRFAKAEWHQKQLEQVANLLLNDTPQREFAIRLLKNTNPNVRTKMFVDFFVNATFLGVPRQIEMSEKLGIHIPWFILIDPTTSCNLRCIGCWAGEYQQHFSLGKDLMDRIIREAKDLGIYFITVSGGEPFLSREFIEVVEKHDDVLFHVYTNGTLIDEKLAKKIVELGNIAPAISIEGFEKETDERRGKGVYAKVMRAMDLLRENGAIFGFSITATRKNVDVITSDEFIDHLIDKGVAFGWVFMYVPIGRDPDFSLMLTPEERAKVRTAVHHWRSDKPVFVADFWNDGPYTGGCIAGGRNYFHINGKGDVEPCAFVHFAIDNIRDKSLVDILKSPFFAEYQRRIPFSENLLRPCPIVDNPWALREIVTKVGAKSTDGGSEGLLTSEMAEKLDEYANRWKVIADKIWEDNYAKKEEKVK